MANIKLLALEKTDREQFIKDNQERRFISGGVKGTVGYLQMMKKVE